MIITTLAQNARFISALFFALIYSEVALPTLVKANEVRNFPKFTTAKGVASSSIGYNEVPAVSPVINKPTDQRLYKPVREPNITKFTGGPVQPEMQSFQSVNASNMVDLFTGDFSYNIPLMDVGGYPINIHYNSGITMDQEASWVGLGWNINPGTITRNMRGLPDDFDGSEVVTKTMSVKDNRTIGVTEGANFELIGKSLSLGLSAGVFHNSYKGWGTETGINAGINAAVGSKGSLSAGLSITNNSQNGLDVSPSFGVSMSENDNKTKGSVTIGTNYNSRMGIQSLQMTGQIRQAYNAEKSQRYIGTGVTSTISFATPSYTPSITMPFTSTQIAFTAKVGAEAWGGHPNFFIRGYGSIQKIADKDKTAFLPAYGYLYYQKARNNPKALLDFNREKEMTYRESVPHIAIPSYTYDAYSITGEGTGGMFRPYRGDVGFVYDHAMSSKSDSKSISLDVGFGSVFHGGVDFTDVDAITKNNPWLEENLLKDVTGFKDADSTYENVYFKNPGEKTSVDKTYLNAIGDASLMRVDLSPLDKQNVPSVFATKTFTRFEKQEPVGKTTFDQNVFRKQRDKRTQVISYLKASEADEIGLGRFIKSYAVNSFPSSNCYTNYVIVPRKDNDKKENHISEMTVLNADGRRYVYGIPVYNYFQKDVSFAVEKGKGNTNTGQTSYEPSDDGVSNKSGKDNFYNNESLPPYAHSFLLSGILSSDYVDITGDGISDDDNGEAIGFTYSRVFNQDRRFTWRAPFDSAAYNEGLKTDRRDDRASYSYGEREVWYLNSVSSKSMIATFRIDNSRLDGYGANAEGGRNPNAKLYKLKEINLYTKADYVKNGPEKAKPIKTVHFEYSYELCKKNPSSVSDSGKLTLKRIWFTYNKNNKGQLNPYVFNYHSSNPDYLKGASDRWGNFKDRKSNPGQLSNADYPYSIQPSTTADSSKVAANAASWHLNNIKLPSGGQINVTYESDDYAYVQNKRAMQFFSIAGFGGSPSSNPTNNLYSTLKEHKDYEYVFINVSEPVNSKEDIKLKYLDGITKLYFKMQVKMPDAKNTESGYEFIPCYAEIDGENYGIKGSASDKKIWIKLKSIKEGVPTAVAAVQFLRLNLPAKAYPYSEPGDNVQVQDVIKMLLSAVTNVGQAFKGFGDYARGKNWCNQIRTDQSFVRLDNPNYKKYGGGIRVKKVEILDNFRKMTAQSQKESVYGQTYDYSTIKEINGVPTRISSGVASYEPAVGNEENPFHLPIEFEEKVGALAPTNYMYTEYPLAESYFPSAMIGYSKVKVQTIHKDRKSATGYEETNFYTSYDFPTLTEFTPLDYESKKTFHPTIRNFFGFAARHNVTLSQGFKVELNDMNGKVKSQASYAQNDLEHPISYTYNYYKVESERTLHKKLVNTVSVIDSMNGVIDEAGQLGKDVEVMVDFREQISSTINRSREVNVDYVHPFPPIILPSYIPVPTSESSRYRSVAVLKVVQRYGILDSVIHIEKGSMITTRNLVYDGQTGEVLLSQTNNEFDDPVFNFNYPSHWAYSGMGLAYKNIGATWSNVNFKQGKILYSNFKEMKTSGVFESGDELWVNSQDDKFPIADVCSPLYNYFFGKFTTKKVWAIEANKGKDGDKGIFFIDKDGKPFTATGASVKIIRSGKRNIPTASVGSITSLKSPIKKVNGFSRVIIDSSTAIISATAGQYKDLWKVDSSLFRKDTVFIIRQLADTSRYPVSVQIDDYFNMEYRRNGKSNVYLENQSQNFSTYSYDEKPPNLPSINTTDGRLKSWLKFDLAKDIPKNVIIKSASLRLYNQERLGIEPHLNQRGSNRSYVRRTIGPWIKDIFRLTSDRRYRDQYFGERDLGLTDIATQAFIPATPFGVPVHRDDTIDVRNMVQAMVDEYYGTDGSVPAAIVMDLVDGGGSTGKGKMSRLSYYLFKFGKPELAVTYYSCKDGSTPIYSSAPVAGYYCYSQPVDSFICKPNIIDSSINPYRWGILGNWRLNRSYSYFDSRVQGDPTAQTNIRTDGEIKSFDPYWTFSNTALWASSDTSRWVWNSEMNQFNRKGYEIENKDPLNRHNSGQYGYNHTLPVAVAQNAKEREKVFDGFEDYDYKTDTCTSCETARFIDLTKNGGSRVDSVSHTGLFSLRLGGNQTATTLINVVPDSLASVAPVLSVKVDSIPTMIKTSVNGLGIGLTGRYYRGTTPCLIRIDTTINISFANPPGGLCGTQFFNVIWQGKVQPKYTDRYTFYTVSRGRTAVYVNNVLLFTSISGNGQNNVPISLQAGQLYNIRVEYSHSFGQPQMRLGWYSSSGLQASQIIPKSQLYQDTTTQAYANRTIHSDTTFCVVLKNVAANKVLNDRFSPIQGKQVVVSGWIKEDMPCLSGSYLNSQLQVTFNNGTPATVNLKPSGNIIEGWQRIEEVITIPGTATTMSLSLKSTSSIPVFFDDIRIHPFNSNMKSFVYNPVNLRLMAELDENNYATFYEYDDDGTLVRVKKETERGVKTIQETRSALIKE